MPGRRFEALIEVDWIADFRKDNGPAIRRVCSQFIVLCRSLELFSEAIVAIDGSKFKAVNNRDKNFTDRKLQARMAQLGEGIGRYLAELDRADREPTAVSEGQVSRLKEKITRIKAQMRHLDEIGRQMQEAPDGQISLTDPDARSMATSGRGTGMVGYNVQTAVDTKHHLIVAHEVTNAVAWNQSFRMSRYERMNSRLWPMAPVGLQAR